MALKAWTLGNNLDVIVNRDTLSKEVTIGCGVKYGTNDAHPKQIELPHLLEHIMFNGTKNMNRDEIHRKIDFMHKTFNAYTLDDHTYYEIATSKKNYKAALDLLSESVNYASLLPSEIEIEKKRVRAEITEGLNNKLDLVTDIYLYTECGLDGLKWVFEERFDSLDRITETDLQKAFVNFYVPNNMAVFVSGDIDLGEAIDSVELRFGKVLSRDANHTDSERFRDLKKWGSDSTKDDRVIKLAGVVTCISAIGFAIPGLSTHKEPKELAEKRVLFDILSNRFTSYSSLYKPPLIYGPGILVNESRSACTFVVENVVGYADFKSLKDRVVKEINDIAKGNISKEEFTKSRSSIREDYSLSGGGGIQNESICECMADYLMLMRRTDYDEYVRSIKDVSIRRVRNLARTIDPNRLTSLLAIPENTRRTRSKSNR